MLKKILNTGVLQTNPLSLNKKIRLSNLMSLATILTMMGYIPSAIYFKITGIIILNFIFLSSAILNFILNKNKKYNTSFYIVTSIGLLYFSAGALFFGLASNLHLFILIMCLLAIALLKSHLILRIYIIVAFAIFFSFVVFFKNKTGIIVLPLHMKTAEEVIGIINLFLLFFITVLFFIFFRRENLLHQKEIMEQKEVIEEKQKEILSSMRYAKRIQNAILPQTKYIDRKLKELTKR